MFVLKLLQLSFKQTSTFTQHFTTKTSREPVGAVTADSQQDQLDQRAEPLHGVCRVWGSVYTTRGGGCCFRTKRDLKKHGWSVEETQRFLEVFLSS